MKKIKKQLKIKQAIFKKRISLSEFEQKQKILNTLCWSLTVRSCCGFRRKSIRCVHFGSMTSSLWKQEVLARKLHWGVKATPLRTPHALLGAASNGWWQERGHSVRERLQFKVSKFFFTSVNCGCACCWIETEMISYADIWLAICRHMQSVFLASWRHRFARKDEAVLNEERACDTMTPFLVRLNHSYYA